MTEVRSRRADGRVGRQGSIFPRRRRPAPVVRRIVLMSLLAICLGLATISYSGDGNRFTGPQRVVLQAVAPIETGLTRVWQPVEDSWSWTTRLVHANNENPQLRDRIDQLETQSVVAKDIAAENDRLREAMAMKDRGRFPDGYDQVMGSVISRSPTEVDRSIVINLGSDDGIEVNDPASSG
ncbi:MAG: hypothetical protein H7123_01795, partial [Thermoleophilia bacterium]|nr:hypothetical protein [Thermoleophilia bacterium]